MRAKKSLGQNFLKSKKALNDIARVAELGEKDTILEVGPGKGALTEILLEKAGRVTAVEKDEVLVKFLEGKFVNGAEAKMLASLPGREALLAQLVGTMKAPISGFYNALHGLLRNFVYVLGEVQKKKPA